jgi:hypothetical protein
MSIPTYIEFQESAATWRGEFEGVSYELSWHSKSEYMDQGIWCWYLILFEEQFLLEDWKKLLLEKQDREFAGSWRRHWAYENFPDLGYEWTFGEVRTHLCRDRVERNTVKVGIDHGHSWDRDNGYYEGKSYMEMEAKDAIKKFNSLFPNQNKKCAWSGIYDTPDKLFETNAGWLVHVSMENKLPDHINWKRK